MLHWTPLELLLSLAGLATSSKKARKAERERLLSILESLRTGLTASARGIDQSEAGRGQFSNAASDFFCHIRVSAASLRGRLDNLSRQVEDALRTLQQGEMSAQEANDLLGALNTEIKSLR